MSEKFAVVSRGRFAILLHRGRRLKLRRFCAIAAIRDTLLETGHFVEVRSEPLHRDLLIELWDKADGGVEATLPAFAYAAFPKTPGVEESYVATVKASDYVRILLQDTNGNIKKARF